MVSCISHHVISPLGEGTEANYQAVKAGRSAIRSYTQRWGMPEPFAASLFTDEQTAALAVEGLTRFESLAYRSALKAVEEAGIDVTDSRTVFILSTTKANIELLTDSNTDADTVGPSTAAEHIARRLGITTTPVVVCNACISGVAALVLALRLLEAEQYDYAIVCGADVQSKFTVSGFQSLKAVSEEACRPFDMERLGLNLGEAAATMVVARPEMVKLARPIWIIERGAIRNDAFHISSPSKNGEGACLALQAVMKNSLKSEVQSLKSEVYGQSSMVTTELAFVNAHGTATMFNDQMESVAIERAGLKDVPVNGLKGFFGHTLGAAGLLETIISMAAIDDGTILGTKGFQEKGVSGKILLSAENTTTTKTAFIKMISGFGGGNAAVLVHKYAFQQERLKTKSWSQSDDLLKPEGLERIQAGAKRSEPPVKVHAYINPEGVTDNSVALSRLPTITHRVRLTSTSVTIDGCVVEAPVTGVQMLTLIYKNYVGDYPKFYKMDGLSRLGLIATELLLGQESGRERFVCCDDRAVILLNHSSSISADRKYLESIADADDFFPSPSVFVYTLPNIVTGEIAMRNNYHGETSFYITDQRNDQLMRQIITASFADPKTKSIVGGWIDYQDDSHFEADIFIIEFNYRK